MAFFANSTGFTISGGEFSNVGQDQHNTRHQTTNYVTDSYNKTTTNNHDSYNQTRYYRNEMRDNRKFVNGNYQDYHRKQEQADWSSGSNTGRAYQVSAREQARLEFGPATSSRPRPRQQQVQNPLPALPPIPAVARFNDDTPRAEELSVQDRADSDRIMGSLNTKQHHVHVPTDMHSNPTFQLDDSSLKAKQQRAERSRSHSPNVHNPHVEARKEAQTPAHLAPPSPPRSQSPPPRSPSPPPAQNKPVANAAVSNSSPHRVVEPDETPASESESMASSQPTGATENVEAEQQPAPKPLPESRKSRNPFKRFHREKPRGPSSEGHRWSPWSWKGL
ncbi:hypothetical protein VNI00_011600 [Paramarasmius palmivorus]|uniref:Uncharacterized protein n=1 Tax=Paramarasmius palmivorus TaxID=297713 RepID=A0AAW0CDZ1_9AGAR